MNTTPRLTAAAQRDLRALAAGQPVAIRFGPYSQLVEAGYITGTQESYTLTEAGRRTGCHGDWTPCAAHEGA